MIRPTKYMDLRYSVINIAATILDELKDAPGYLLIELDETIQARLGQNARFNFVSALNFLYVSGKLDYDNSADVVFLKEKSE